MWLSDDRGLDYGSLQACSALADLARSTHCLELSLLFERRKLRSRALAIEILAQKSRMRLASS